jgi:ATP-dependent Clp endopeptidase proteolytic subunit ClpP
MRIQHRSLFKPRGKGGYRITNQAKADAAEMYIYDEISWWGVSAESVVNDLKEIEAATINLHLNSPGGAVFEGLTIYNALKNHPAKIIVHIDGLAASIASIIAMVGQEIVMAENAFLMIHEPWSFVVGGATEMRQEADLLDKIGGQLVQTYVDRSGATEDQVQDWMGAETWFTAQEAMDAGFIDRIDPNQAAQARMTFDLSAYAHVPDTLQGATPSPTERDIEKALREVGLSRTEAKKLVAEGWQAGQRDAEPPAPKAPEPPRDATPEPVKDAVAALLAETDIFLSTTATPHVGGHA